MFTAVLKFATPIVFGIWAVRHLAKVLSYLGPSLKARQAENQRGTQAEHSANEHIETVPAPVAPVVTGVKGLDILLDGITTFFEELLDDEANYVIAVTIFAIMVPGTAWFAVEGLREGGMVLHFAFPVLSLLYQVVGISVVAPLLWIPLYLSSAPITTSSTLSVATMASVGLGFFLAHIPSAIMVAWPKGHFRTVYGIQLFQISMAMAWIPFAATPFLFLNEISSSRAEAKFFFAVGAGAVALHAWLVAKTMGNIRLVARVWELRSLTACKDSFAKTVGHFIFFESVILYITLVYAVVLKGGVEYGAYVLALTPIVGPAASLSFAFGHLAL
ncbi:hypothetical protein BC830DRAFT_1163537 [Chytriomyces sp. MP71]|nr:hypothetical protein BC830DRAFT_1163537 [Chytriomyces sp. MP71]